MQEGTPVTDNEAFFIILSGHFDVHRSQKKQASGPTAEEDAEATAEPTSGGQSVSTRNVLGTAVHSDELLRMSDAHHRRSLFGEKVVTLTVGDSFGHDALAAMESVRNSSVVASQAGELLLLSRAKYVCDQGPVERGMLWDVL